jgi:AraC-like DNA-binding protein
MRNRPSFNSLPTTTGVIARAAYARALNAGLEVGPLLKAAHLTPAQAKNARFRVPVKTEIKLLNEIADRLPDPSLGLHLAEDIDLRTMGLLYYVLASSETLGDSLKRLARYSRINNEGIRITCRERKDITVKFEHVGVSRLSDRHQMEFFVLILLRTCRQLTGRNLSPTSVKIAHRRAEIPAGIGQLFGCKAAFGTGVDEVVYSRQAASTPGVNADPYLNNLLEQYCEEALANRSVRSGPWRLKVENAVVPLLPHGQAKLAEIAQRLGISRRTLERMLASEGSSFRGIFDALRSDLAKRYLGEQNLPLSEVAWLLGFHEVSAFNHACKRWTGLTPKQVRSGVLPHRSHKYRRLGRGDLRLPAAALRSD